MIVSRNHTPLEHWQSAEKLSTFESIWEIDVVVEALSLPISRQGHSIPAVYRSASGDFQVLFRV